jgi:hypothetical protein
MTAAEQRHRDSLKQAFAWRKRHPCQCAKCVEKRAERERRASAKQVAAAAQRRGYIG